MYAYICLCEYISETYIYIEARDEDAQVVFTRGLGEMKMSGEGERRRKQYRGCPSTNRQAGRPRPLFQRRGTPWRWYVSIGGQD